MTTSLERKDLIAISISFVALIVSLIGAYFTFFWSKDDISVSLNRYPGLYFSGEFASDGSKPEIAMLAVSPTQTFTFVNNGTRPASILSVDFYNISVKKIDPQIRDCRKIPEADQLLTIGTGYSLEPFAIKPGEIVVKSARLATAKEKAAWFEPEIAEDGNPRIYACIEFTIVVPGRGVQHVAKVVGHREEKDFANRFKQTSSGDFSYETQVGPWPRGAAIPLIKKGHFFGFLEPDNSDIADYGVAGCGCGDADVVGAVWADENKSSQPVRRPHSEPKIKAFK